MRQARRVLTGVAVLAMLTAMLALTGAAAAKENNPAGPSTRVASPGPDAFGYTSVTIPGNLRDVSATGTPLPHIDDSVLGPLPIGFTFNFYGVSYTEIWSSSNGFLTFQAPPTSGCCTGQPLPGTGSFAGAGIAGLWEDIDPPEGGVVASQTLGAAPNREFVLGFYDTHHFPSGNPVTFEMILHENGDVELQYGATSTDGGTHSIGQQDHTATDGLQILLGGGALPAHTGYRTSTTNPLCNGVPVTLLGTPIDDDITGTAGPDVIHGLGGNDILRGANGDDIICGGEGNDQINGGDGNDQLFGQPGDDVIKGGNGNDLMVGATGNDVLYGGGGADDLRGGDGDDDLFGEGGADYLGGGPGFDRLDGDGADDTCRTGEVLVSCEL